jgi:hypothetical protein
MKITVEWCVEHGQAVEAHSASPKCEVIQLEGEVPEWDGETRDAWWEGGERPKERKYRFAQTMDLYADVIVAPWADPNELVQLLRPALEEAIVETVNSMTLTDREDEMDIDDSQVRMNAAYNWNEQ